MISIKQTIKQDHTDIDFLMTVNDDDALPEPMKRPGRIDTCVWFDLPNKIERRMILKGYLEDLVPKEKRPATKAIELYVTKSDGLAAAWLKEIALQCRYETQAEVLKTITAMKRLTEGARPQRVRRRRRRKIERKSVKPVVVVNPEATTG